MDWITLKVGEETGIFRVELKDEVFSVMWWDMTTLFVEELDGKEVLKRAKDRNKSFEYNLESLKVIFKGKPKDATLEIVDGDLGRKLNLKYYPENIPFYFHWNLKEGIREIGRCMILPLMGALQQSISREKELERIIGQKDDEIEDYRRQEIPLINKFLQTAVFDGRRKRRRRTEWDSLLDGDNTDSLCVTLPDLFPKVEAEDRDLELEEETATSTTIVKKRTESSKRKFLKQIQKQKIGISSSDLKYSQESQELSSVDLEPIEEPPSKVPSTCTQTKNKRRLMDIL